MATGPRPELTANGPRPPDPVSVRGRILNGGVSPGAAGRTAGLGPAVLSVVDTVRNTNVVSQLRRSADLIHRSRGEADV